MSVRVPAALLATLLALAGAAGCGGDDESDRAPRETLRETFRNMDSVESGRIDVDISFRARGDGNESTRASADGVFDEGRRGELPRFDFDLSAEGIAAGAVSTGRAGFVEFAGAAYELDRGTFETLSTLYGASDGEREADRTFERLGIDPERWITGLRNEGTHEVGGEDTVHISGRLDVERFFRDIRGVRGQLGELAVPGAESLPRLSDPKELAESVESARFDLYTETGDLLLRRMRARLRLERPDGARGGPDSISLDIDMRLDELNEPQEVRAPENARPLRELLGRVEGLGDLLPETRGNGSSGPNEESEPSGPGGLSQDQAREYLECIREAKDQADLRRCSEGLR